MRQLSRRTGRTLCAFLVGAVLAMVLASPASAVVVSTPAIAIQQGATYAYDTAVYNYDAPAYLSSKSAATSGARGALAGHRAAPRVSHAPLARFGDAAETAAGASTSVGDLLMPGGSALGKAGTDATIREITGGLPEAQSVFSQLTQGGRVVAQTPSLTRVQLPDGGFVQLRTIMSRSPNTAATIDVNIPGIDITKLKFNP